MSGWRRERAEAAAGRVEQDGVERAPRTGGRSASAADHAHVRARPSARRARPACAAVRGARARPRRRRRVGADEVGERASPCRPGAAQASSDRPGPAARRATSCEPWSCSVEQARAPRARRAAGRGAPGTGNGEARELEAGGGRARSRASRPARVEPRTVGGRLREERAGTRDRAPRPEPREPALGQPRRAASRSCVSQASGSRAASGSAGGAFAREPPQHRVHEARSARGSLLAHELDRLGDRGAVGHAQVEELVRAEPQRLAHGRVELRRGGRRRRAARAPGRARRAGAACPARARAGTPRSRGVQRLARRRAEAVARACGPRLDVEQDLERAPACVGGHAQPSRAPGTRRAPAANAAAGIARRLSGWTSSEAAAASRRRTPRRGPRGRRPRPCPASPRPPAARRARSILQPRPPSDVVAPGQGWKPRTRRAIAARRQRPVDAPVLLPDDRRVRGALGSCGDRRRAFRPRGPRSSRPAAAAPSRRGAPRARPPSRRGRSACVRASSVGPVSRPSSISIVVTPVSRLAVHDRPLDRRGAAVAGQQRGVDVDGAARRRCRSRCAAGSGRRRRRPAARARSARSASCASGSLTRRGCSTGRPRAQRHRLHAAAARGRARAPSPCPAG